MIQDIKNTMPTSNFDYIIEAVGVKATVFRFYIQKKTRNCKMILDKIGWVFIEICQK